MTHDVVLSETFGKVRVLTLNRPEKANAASLEMQQRILAEVRAAAAGREVAALVITGAGQVFSAGGDRAVLQQMLSGDFPDRDAYSRNYMELLRTFMTMDLPVVAAVNGPAIGFAAGLVALCDIVVMAENAQIAEPHARFGAPADLSARLMWPRLTSIAMAKELLMTGRAVGAEEALRIGLVNRVCPPGQALPTALQIAQDMASCPDAGLRVTKQTFNIGLLEEAQRVLRVLAPGQALE